MALQQQLQQLALPFLNAPVPEYFVPHVTLARKFQSVDAFPLTVEPLTPALHRSGFVSLHQHRAGRKLSDSSKLIL